MKRITAISTLLFFCSWLPAQITHSLPLPEGLDHCRDTFTVYVIGDVMMHERQLHYDCSTFLKEISPEMRRADLCVANMEFTLAGKPYAGYPRFSAPEHYPEYVVGCGADVLLLANNHILDYGSSGLDRTLRVYDELCDSTGARYTGVGGSPLVFRKGGYSIAFVNFTYGTNCGPDARVNYSDTLSVSRAIASARGAGADFIVALPHWGEEYSLTHSERQASMAEWLVSKGVDAVVGSHPHVVQDTTRIRGVPVIYSLGNAVSDMSATNTRLELAVTLTFVCENGRKRMLEPELQFLWCTRPGKLLDGYAVVPVAEWLGRRDAWLDPGDYDNMVATLRRVLAATGISVSANDIAQPRCGHSQQGCEFLL